MELLERVVFMTLKGHLGPVSRVHAPGKRQQTDSDDWHGCGGKLTEKARIPMYARLYLVESE
jgi:hypothetical protein